MTQCPRLAVPAAAWEIVAAASEMEHGLLPMAGGTADQAAAFVEAARFARAEMARVESEILDAARK